MIHGERLLACRTASILPQTWNWQRAPGANWFLSGGVAKPALSLPKGAFKRGRQRLLRNLMVAVADGTNATKSSAEGMNSMTAQHEGRRGDRSAGSSQIYFLKSLGDDIVSYQLPQPTQKRFEEKSTAGRRLLRPSFYFRRGRPNVPQSYGWSYLMPDA